LKLGEAGGYRWLKPGVDLKKYNKFMVDSVIFFWPTRPITRASMPRR